MTPNPFYQAIKPADNSCPVDNKGGFMRDFSLVFLQASPALFKAYIVSRGPIISKMITMVRMVAIS